MSIFDIKGDKKVAKAIECKVNGVEKRYRAHGE